MVQNESVVAECSGRVKEQTCTRIEFRAAIEAMKAVPIGSKFILGTDSKILVDIMRLEVQRWRANHWLKPNGKPIPNLDLILELHELNQKHSIQWTWIRGHAGNVYNERCDELCRLAQL